MHISGRSPANVATGLAQVLSLGAFAKLRKATISLISVRPSVRLSLSAWNDWAPTGRIFMKYDI